MKVKIGDKIYDSAKEPLMVILSIRDRENIRYMSPIDTRYCAYPEGMSQEDADEFMQTDLPATEGVEFKPLPDFGDHMLVANWLQNVEGGGFIDYDGHGYWATATEQSNMVVLPSYITDDKVSPPSWATHVAWYNK